MQQLYNKCLEILLSQNTTQIYVQLRDIFIIKLAQTFTEALYKNFYKK